MNKADPVFFAEPELFRRWLERHSRTKTELLVGFWKVGSGRPSMTWSESVDEALCFGWIDGVRRRIDEHAYSIRFTPRRPGSNWSAVNIAKYQTLLSEGRLTQAGKDAYTMREESKSSGYSYEQKEVATLTQLEVKQFKQKPEAWTYFEDCPPGYKKKIVHWIASAKKSETRASRLEKLISACSKQQRLQ